METSSAEIGSSQIIRSGCSTSALAIPHAVSVLRKIHGDTGCGVLLFVELHASAWDIPAHWLLLYFHQFMGNRRLTIISTPSYGHLRMHTDPERSSASFPGKSFSAFWFKDVIFISSKITFPSVIVRRIMVLAQVDFRIRTLLPAQCASFFRLKLTPSTAWTI